MKEYPLILRHIHTNAFLAVCKKYGIKKVGINFKIDGSPPWYDGSIYSDSVFKGSWPAIWEVVEKAKLTMGCGNTFQAQVYDIYKLIPGVYCYLDNKWKKL
jgi:hypothetical protein